MPFAERRYLTDDCDQSDMELRLFMGDNGDWYLSILPQGDRLTRHTVRITTRGQRLRGMVLAMHALWVALGGAA